LPASAQTDYPEDDLMRIDEEGRPVFTRAKETGIAYRVETRKIPVPPHRMSPLKASWPKVYPPLVEHLKLQVRMNVKNRAVELRTSKSTSDLGALQKGEDFVKAFTLGFDVDDAIALLRLDDLYIETFEIKDVKTLNGDHLSRAIGRIAGKDGKTKFAIENASRTRVVLADQKIHILGGFKNIHIAREAIVSLILGSPPVSPQNAHDTCTMLIIRAGQSLWQPAICCFSYERTLLTLIYMNFFCFSSIPPQHDSGVRRGGRPFLRKVLPWSLGCFLNIALIWDIIHCKEFEIE
jgi:RNA-binding protein PNO1